MVECGISPANPGCRRQSFELGIIDTELMNNLDIAPPQELTISLWRSLVLNLIDRVAPESLPPLQLTSKPMDVGMLIGDRLDRPWYRSIFTNIADVVSPEILPALELTSSPVDVGELLGDEMAHGWWHSLLGTLRDRLSPERLPALELTSQPFAAFEADTWLQILDWSSLLDNPKVYLPDAPRADESYGALETPFEVIVPIQELAPAIIAAQAQFRRDISRSRLRQKVWISLVAAEVAFLVFAAIKFV
jgi:hypothetical protein